MIVELPCWDAPESGIPPELYHLRGHELVWDTPLYDVRVEGEELVVAGAARVRGVFRSETQPVADAVLTTATGKQVRADSVLPGGVPVSDSRDGAEANLAGFEARFRLRDLADADPPQDRQPPVVWIAEIGWSAPSLRRTGRPTRLVGQRPGPLLSTLALPGVVIDAWFDADRGLRVELRRRPSEPTQTNGLG
ncbi:MAG: hypothetical protein H0V19_03990 [Euzebyales bacterium]|nr:hypothetical protein [Euzebyales bacterium]MBA3620948.1 hypothetical protein [Euzebyales bacterium]